MSVSELTVPIGQIVPIQFELSRPRLEELKDYDYLSPGAAIIYPYPLRLGVRYLLVDGHHRVYLEYQAGRQEAELIVATEDEHLPRLRELIINWSNKEESSIDGCKTIEEVHERYRAIWRPALKAAGVYRVAYGIPDIPVVDKPRPRYSAGL